MWTVAGILEAVEGRLMEQALAPETLRRIPVERIALDSRRVNPGEAFVALTGRRLDAHAFIPEAVGRGAACLVVSRALEQLVSVPTIQVEDTTRALGRLAAAHRRRFALPVVAVTGSCGKTTTKELLAHLLSHQHRVLKTAGTQNNHIGVPLTLLQLSAAHEMAVVELGSNHSGEIAYLAGLASPTMAVITNVGPAHLEFFGSIEAIFREKLSLLSALPPGGTAVLPGDQLDVLLQAQARLPEGARVVTFGSTERCDVQAVAIRKRPEGWSLRLRGVAGEFVMSLPGSHNVENALAALACVSALGVPLESVQEPLSRFAGLPMRSEVFRCGDVTIVNDCYNANPLSFARALEILQDVEAQRKVVIAGDMLELGAHAVGAHRSIGELAATSGCGLLIGVGAFAQAILDGAAASPSAPARLVAAADVSELLPMLSTLIRPGDGVLIKGSRGARLEQVTEWLCQGRNGHGTH
ncbi:MAG: UDP-N-acetylmuramoyl-tripeptide--D-alanyl-D-alanine ligase [Candidatus Omnitrophica bacterium]|nr:UDP-N-acetylmuramoyl-tripeptide--D-alanyl-D-alanine ligase [Candidatus Omnitrophota bacterium]